MLDIHSEALRDVNEALHNFFLRYKEPAKCVYGFVEGKDDPMFYKNIVERFMPEGWSVDLIRAGNKQKVMQCYSVLDWNNFRKSRVCFFVDRDLEDLVESSVPQDENIYVTDGYSIENAVVNRSLVIQLLGEVYNIVDLLPDEEDNLRNNFDEDLARFQSWLSPIMAQIVQWRRDRAVARLDEIDLRPLLEFRDGRVKIAVGFETDMSRVLHAGRCLNLASVEANSLEILKTEFEAVGGPVRLTRGKYILWFMQAYLGGVHASIAKYAHAYSTPPKMRVSVGPGNFQVFAAPRARCPQSLRLFIEKNYIKFCEEATLTS